MKITLEFKRALKAIRSELSKFRRDPAWKFSLLADRGEFHQRTLWSLERERNGGRELLAHYERQIQEWEESLKRQPARRRPLKRRAVPKDEFWF